MKRLPLIGVISAATFALTACAWNVSAKPAGKVKTRLVQVPAVRATSRALKITPLHVKRDDAAELLGVMMWQFDVQLPQPVRSLDFVLELREKGKAAQRLVGASHFTGLPMPANGHLKVLVGTHPLTGVLRESEKAKYMVRINEYRISKLSTAGSSVASVVATNSFDGLTGMESSSIPAQRKDGSFVLISGNRSSDSYTQPNAPDVELVFTTKSLP